MGLCVVDKKSGELKTGCFMYGYLLVHILTSTLFLIDIILMVAGGGDRIVDALLGTTVVCQQPVTKRD